jgi:hypothetical protein
MCIFLIKFRKIDCEFDFIVFVACFDYGLNEMLGRLTAMVFDNGNKMEFNGWEI